MSALRVWLPAVHFLWRAIMISTEANFQDLASRVLKLEVQNRRWKFAAALLGLLGVSLIAMAAKPIERFESAVLRARVVEAENFVLKDDNGHVYARLTLEADRTRQQLSANSPAVLEFYDEHGNVVATVPVTGGFLPVK
jgi:hypothetical protein